MRRAAAKLLPRDEARRLRRRPPQLAMPPIRPFPQRCPRMLNPSTSARAMATIASTSCAGITRCGVATIRGTIGEGAKRRSQPTYPKNDETVKLEEGSILPIDCAAVVLMESRSPSRMGKNA